MSDANKKEAPITDKDLVGALGGAAAGTGLALATGSAGLALATAGVALVPPTLQFLWRCSPRR
jgi:hypothetical protein